MVQDGHGDGWHPARLIPAMGIRGQEEQEKRATTSLLAVMRVVPEFGHALLGPLGPAKGRISTYAEVRLKDSAGKTHIPDGAVVVERGKTLCRCLVELKTTGRHAGAVGALTSATFDRRGDESRPTDPRVRRGAGIALAERELTTATAAPTSTDVGASPGEP